MPTKIAMAATSAMSVERSSCFDDGRSSRVGLDTL